MKKLLFLICTIAAMTAVLTTSCIDRQAEYDKLFDGFMEPGPEAKPRVWYHWMNGNISQEGMEKDLKWMDKSGIGGFHNFDAGLSVPQVVPERLIYMTPEWKKVFTRMVNMADSLGMEVAVAASPGWSQSGGPWVKPEEAMKKLVWSETAASGNGQEQVISLPAPPSGTGAFMTPARKEGENTETYDSFVSRTGKPDPEYYEDVAVIAYPVDGFEILENLNPKVSSSGGRFTLSELNDGDYKTSSLLPYTKDEDPWIQYEFDSPQTVCAARVSGGTTRGTWGVVATASDRAIYASDDGKIFRKIADVPPGGVSVTTVSLPSTTARYFRLVFKNRNGGWTPGVSVAEWKLLSYAHVDHAEDKAGFSALYDLQSFETLADGAVAVSDVSKVQVLTAKMDADGNLKWAVPQGSWHILRIGWSLTGHKNSPASPEATGLEVDKLNRTYVKNYFDHYLGLYKDASGGLMGERGLQYIMMDSYEAGQENWTPGLAEEFESRRGYSLWPWMPALTGVVISSPEQTEQFLWDWRKTLGELVTENYYDQTGEILHAIGMKRYTESHENGRVYQIDGMDAKHAADIPMSAMWVREPGASGGSTYEMAIADIRESASVSHIYGQPYVAAESMTVAGNAGTAFNFYPARLKYTADLEMACGLTRYVQHTSVHQPVDSLKPGESLSMFGQWLTRQETWAERADIWFNYLARGSYMQQQGRFVADIAYYYGEDNNVTGLFGAGLPEMPYGYEFDFINPDALLNRLQAKKGKLVTETGMEYSVLVLDPNVRRMSTEVLKKIASLAKAGITICGSKPEVKADLSGSDVEWKALADEVWGGKYPNVSTRSIKEVMPELQAVADFSFVSGDGGTTLRYVHRTLGKKGEIYWVSNARKNWEDVTVTCRTSGYKPMLWRPDRATAEEVSYKIHDGVTDVTLRMSPEDAVFLVFMLPAQKDELVLARPARTAVATLDGQWNVRFQEGLGAPAEAVFDELAGWQENGDPGIRYFSGAATYSKKFKLSSEQVKDGKILIDLGDVKNIAEVSVNGQYADIVWKEPFTIDVTEMVREGENTVEIKVWNQWVNRIIGDMQPGADKKYTYAVMNFYRADSPLQPSGLLGPVTIINEK